MPDLLVRDRDEGIVTQLKERAHSNGRSLGMELKLILERAAQQVAMTKARPLAEPMTRRLEGRPHTDGSDLLREDRGP